MDATTPTALDLYDEFVADWNAAMRPCLDCTLASCPEDEREALHLLIDGFLLNAPSPPYSPVQHRRLHEQYAPMVERVMNDPAVIAQQDQLAAAWRDKPWYEKAYRRVRFAAFWRWTLWRARRRPAPWE